MLYPPLSGSQLASTWPVRKLELESTMLLTLMSETVPYMFQAYELHKCHLTTIYDDDANTVLY